MASRGKGEFCPEKDERCGESAPAEGRFSSYVGICKTTPLLLETNAKSSQTLAKKALPKPGAFRSPHRPARHSRPVRPGAPFSFPAVPAARRPRAHGPGRRGTARRQRPRGAARSSERRETRFATTFSEKRHASASRPSSPPSEGDRPRAPRTAPHVRALRRQTRHRGPRRPAADGLLPCGPQPPPCRCAPPAAAPRGDLLPRSLESVLRSGSAMPGRSAGGRPPARRELPHGGVPPRARLPPRRRRAHTWHSCAGREAAPQCACPRRPIAAPRRGPVPRRPGRRDRLGSEARRAPRRRARCRPDSRRSAEEPGIAGRGERCPGSGENGLRAPRAIADFVPRQIRREGLPRAAVDAPSPGVLKRKLGEP